MVDENGEDLSSFLKKILDEMNNSKETSIEEKIEETLSEDNNNLEDNYEELFLEEYEYSPESEDYNIHRFLVNDNVLEDQYLYEDVFEIMSNKLNYNSNQPQY